MVMLVLRRKAGFTSRLGAAIFALTPYPLSAAIQPISERSLAERGGNPLERMGAFGPILSRWPLHPPDRGFPRGTASLAEPRRFATLCGEPAPRKGEGRTGPDPDDALCG
jgi:hypothetical protein